MRFKSTTVFYVVIRTCTIYWRDKEEVLFCKTYTILNLTSQTKVLIKDSS